MTLAGGHDERRPAVGALLVDRELDLARVETLEDLPQHGHIALHGAIMEHGLLRLEQHSVSRGWNTWNRSTVLPRWSA